MKFNTALVGWEMDFAGELMESSKKTRFNRKFDPRSNNKKLDHAKPKTRQAWKRDQRKFKEFVAQIDFLESEAEGATPSDNVSAEISAMDKEVLARIAADSTAFASNNTVSIEVFTMDPEIQARIAANAAATTNNQRIPSISTFTMDMEVQARISANVAGLVANDNHPSADVSTMDMEVQARIAANARATSRNDNTISADMFSDMEAMARIAANAAVFRQQQQPDFHAEDFEFDESSEEEAEEEDDDEE